MTAAPTDPLLGSVLDGRYRIEELIATGGMASVYRGIDTRLDRDVAIKVMRAQLARDQAFVERFRREARAAAQLTHPHVVAVYDQGEDRDQVFLAMEYVPGRTLREVLDAEGPLTPRAAIDIMDPVLQALAAAHRAGLMHRDVKPENVIVRDDGVVKVADFGLARAVASEATTSPATEVYGTLSYISPEQITGGEVTTRSDVYAAGLILFELLTGRKAFTGDSVPNVMYQHLHSGVPAPSSVADGIPPALDSLVEFASAKDPRDRPADAGEFLDELRHVRARLSDAVLDKRPVTVGAQAGVTAPLPRMPDVAETAVLAVPDSVTAPPTARMPIAPPAGPRRPAGSSVHPIPERPVSGDAAPPKRRRRGWIAALVALLLAGGLAAGWWFRLGPGATTTVPRLVELTQQQAEDALGTAHLDARFTTAFSEAIAKGRVISATPKAGTTAHRGDQVTVKLSKGPERYQVPDLAGRTRAEATAALKDENLLVGAVTQDYSDTVTAGQVISTNPTTGVELKRGQAVDLLISLGPKPIDIPSLTGQTLDQATTTVENLGLTLQRGDDVYSLDVPEGQVAVQNPSNGTLPKGGTITVQLSKGPELVPLPDVYRKSEAEATAILEAAGFKVEVNKILGAPLDTVTGQSPNPSDSPTAAKGSTVTITVV